MADNVQLCKNNKMKNKKFSANFFFYLRRYFGWRKFEKFDACVEWSWRSWPAGGADGNKQQVSITTLKVTIKKQLELKKKK